jgi:hypothetical protein
MICIDTPVNVGDFINTLIRKTGLTARKTVISYLISKVLPRPEYKQCCVQFLPTTAQFSRARVVSLGANSYFTN